MVCQKKKQGEDGEGDGGEGEGVEEVRGREYSNSHTHRPMDLLTQGLTPFMLGPLNPCSAVLLKNLEISTKSTNGQMKQSRTSNFHILKDVWEEIYPAIPKHERIPSSERYESLLFHSFLQSIQKIKEM